MTCSKYFENVLSREKFVENDVEKSEITFDNFGSEGRFILQGVGDSIKNNE